MTGIWLGTVLLTGAAFDWPGVIVCAGIILLGVLTRRCSAALAMALLAAAAVGAWRIAPTPERALPVELLTSPAVRGRVESGPVQTPRFTVFSLKQESGAVVCVSAPPAPSLGLHDRVIVGGHVEPLDDQTPALRAALRSRGCDGTLFANRVTVQRPGRGLSAALDRFRQQMTGTLQAAYPGDAGALLAGLTTGDDAFLSRQRRQEFLATNTSHITAVSGSNLATLATLLALLGAGIGGGRSSWWQTLTIGAIWVYVAMIGAPAPAYRAGIVATLAIVAVRLGRRPDFVTLTIVVAAVQIMLRPGDFASLAYQLSTAASLGLVLSLQGRRVDSPRGMVVAAVVAVCAAQLATAPITMQTFGTVSPWSAPVNVIIGPLCAAALPFALLAALVGEIHPMLGMVVAAPAALVVNAVLAIVAFAARLPGSGSAMPWLTTLPVWLIGSVSAAAIATMSPECRDGGRRIGHAVWATTWNERVIAAGGVAGCAVGLLALLLR